jgi:uncharacterized protein YcbK (DUF882 family)
MSKYFSEKEQACPCCKVNKVDPNFIKRLDELREKFGKPISVSSMYRCANHNAAVGGVPKSQHVNGIAADLFVLNMNAVDKYLLLKDIVTLGFTVGVRDDILHVDTRAGLPIYFTYKS